MQSELGCKAVLRSAVLGLSPWLAVAAIAQTIPAEEESISRIKPGWFHLSVERLSLDLESGYEWREVRERRARRTTLHHKNVDFRLRESAAVQLGGDVVDPELVEWTADLRFGLQQDRFREEIDGLRRVDSANGLLQEYDISLTLLQSKPVSLTAFARRWDDRIPRRFLPSLREKSTEAGASVLAVTGDVTTELGFDWRDVDRTGNKRQEDDEHLESSRFFVDSQWRISERQNVKLNYEHQEQESTYQGSRFDFDNGRDELRLDHELTFGEKNGHRLDTLFRLNEERGDLNRDELELSTRLALRHTDQLKTFYRYNFYSLGQDALQVDQHKLDLQTAYHASEHLRFSTDVFGLFERAEDDPETHRFGASLDTSYRRPTDAGELSINLALGFDREQIRGQERRRLVINEAHGLSDVRPVFLREQSIVWTSIVAHNLQRTRYYVPGLDYTLRFLGNHIGIRRIPTGRITENEVVYFDYFYLLPAGATTNTYRSDLLLEHRFNFGLTPYYYFEGRFQHVDFDSPSRPLQADNMDRHRMGLRYERERWSLSSEYEIFDDSIEPYDAWHLIGRGKVLRAAEHSLDVTGELSRYWFEGGLDDRRVWWANFDVGDRWQLLSGLAMNTALGYRWEEDSVDGTTNGVDLEWALSYTRNYLTVDLTVEYDLLSFDDSREKGYGLFLRVSRDLSHLLVSR